MTNMPKAHVLAPAAMGRAWVVWGCLLALVCFVPVTARAQNDGDWQALQDGTILLMRHALAPGTGDPSTFVLDDCATQRNLDERGREQARQWGESIRARGVAVGAVWSSQWCRTLETARLMAVGEVQGKPVFNSFFQDFSEREQRTREAAAALASWQGPGVLVVVSHQVNISALTGKPTRSGEGVIVRWQGQALEVLGRLPAP